MLDAEGAEGREGGGEPPATRTPRRCPGARSSPRSGHAGNAARGGRPPFPILLPPLPADSRHGAAPRAAHTRPERTAAARGSSHGRAAGRCCRAPRGSAGCQLVKVGLPPLCDLRSGLPSPPDIPRFTPVSRPPPTRSRCCSLAVKQGSSRSVPFRSVGALSPQDSWR